MSTEVSSAVAGSDGARGLGDVPGAFAELGRLMVHQPLGQFLQQVAELASQALPGVDDVSVTLVEDGETTSAAFTSSSAAMLDERRYEAGFGPCLEAAVSGETIRVDLAAGDDRFPAFVAVARRQGLRGAVAAGVPVPLGTVDAALGLFSATSAVSAATVALAQTFASYAAAMIANTYLYGLAFRRAEQLQEAMDSRAVIEQAKGIIMALHQVDADAAFTHLSEASQSTNTKLRDLAGDIVARAQQGVVTPDVPHRRARDARDDKQANR